MIQSEDKWDAANRALRTDNANLTLAVKLLFDWCGFNWDKPNTVIAMGAKDIIEGRHDSEKALQAGVLARQKVAERNRKVTA